MLNIRHLTLACLAIATLRADNIADFPSRSYGYGVFTYAIYCQSEGKAPDALAGYQLAVENNPGLGRAWLLYGDALLNAHQPEKVAECYRKAIQLEPDNLYAPYNLACFEASLGQADKALSLLQQALDAGYNRFERMAADPDLAPLAKTGALSRLIENQKRKPPVETVHSRFLLSDLDGKLALLHAELKRPGSHWKDLADIALMDSSPDVRQLALSLHATVGGDDSIPTIARSLYDNNGYVCKIAGNSLVRIGPACLPYVNAILASERDNAKFYAQQVKKLIETARTASP